MAHSESLRCTTPLYTTESRAETIGDLCPVFGLPLDAGGRRGEIVEYRVVETRRCKSHGGASRAGHCLMGRVGEIIARRELKHARVRSKLNAAMLNLSAHTCEPVALRG
jgi:hypothetical protein